MKKPYEKALLAVLLLAMSLSLGAEEAKGGPALPQGFASKLIGNVSLPEGETAFALFAAKDGSAYTLVSKAIEGLLQKREVYYVRQGSRKIGPLSSFWQGDAGSWSAGDDEGKKYAGSAVSMAGPLDYGEVYDLRGIGDKRVAFLADVGDEAFVQIDSVRKGPYTYVHSLTIAPASGKVACFGQKDGKSYLVTEEGSSGPYEYGQAILWTPDGKDLAFSAETDSGQVVVYKGETKGPYKEVSGMTFAPDGKTLAYEADGSIYAGSEKLGPYDGEVSGLVFSPNGRRFAFSVYKGDSGKTVRLDTGESYGPFAYDGLSFSFSPDSKTFFCAGLDYKDYKLVICSGKDKRVIDKKWATPAVPLYGKDGKLAAFAADLEWDSWRLYDAKGSSSLAPGLSYGILADGSAAYWSQRADGLYLVKSDSATGPFSLACDLSDAKTLRWAALYRSTLCLISCDR
jgi:WD40 repeat protein